MTHYAEDKYEAMYGAFEEEQHRSNGGGGGGKRKERKPDSVTSKAARAETVEHAMYNRVGEAHKKTDPIIKSLLKNKSEFESVKLLKDYVDWINLCIGEQSLYLDPETDIDVQFTRSSGPGGQNVNKTSSAVRVVHKITGIAAESSQERDQVKNRSLAMETLQQTLISHLEAWRIQLRDGNTKAQPRELKVEDL